MPWKRVGNKVYHLSGGKWRVKQVCSSVENAKKTLLLLRMKKAKGEIR